MEITDGLVNLWQNTGIYNLILSPDPKLSGIEQFLHVFGHPILIINAYQTKQQKDEQKGFEAILEGLCNMFRNPLAHQPKIEWSINEQDALEILSLISYCHTRLDNAVRIGD